MSRFLNIPEGISDIERLRLVYKSLVDECKDSNALLASLRSQLADKDQELATLRRELAELRKALT